MIKHKIFHKGEKIYALLSSYSNPNVLIPIKGIIKDIEFDEVNPRYQIRAVKFYDSINFLKKNLFDCSFPYRFDRRPRKFKINKNKPRSVDELQYRLNANDRQRYYFVVDSIMAFQFRNEMTEMFNMLQDHIIEKKFRELRDEMTRTFYKNSTYSLDSWSEFYARLGQFIGDRVDDFNKYKQLL